MSESIKNSSVRHLLALVLLIPAMILAKDYAGGELRTHVSYTYGRFEVRMRSTAGSGIVSSFFTYHDKGMGWNEIDVEILGAKQKEVQFNTITPGQTNHVYTEHSNFDPHADFHTYAFEWTPEYVAWFIDGREIHRQTGAHIATLVHPQKIMMNLWQPEHQDWVGKFDPSILPVFAYYDWVKYYAYAPDSGKYGSAANFEFVWVDDFSTWDTSRWGKATHTFGGNAATFVPDNVVFRDGQMILCLTLPEATGYHQKHE